MIKLEQLYGVVPLPSKDTETEWHFRVCEISPLVLASRKPLCADVCVSKREAIAAREVQLEPNRDEFLIRARAVAMERARELGARLILEAR